MQQLAGNQAAAAKEQDHRQRQHKGRRHDGQHGYHVEQLFHHPGAHAHIAIHIGKQQTDERGAKAHDHAQQQRIAEGLVECVILEDARKGREGEMVVVHLDVNVVHFQRVGSLDGAAVLLKQRQLRLQLAQRRQHGFALIVHNAQRRGGGIGLAHLHGAREQALLGRVIHRHQLLAILRKQLYIGGLLGVRGGRGAVLPIIDDFFAAKQALRP